jgi:hypothetical protein
VTFVEQGVCASQAGTSTCYGPSTGANRTPGGVRFFLLAFVALAATFVAASVASVGTTYYAVGKTVCKTRLANVVTCFAERLVLVNRRVKSARAFKQLAAGATGFATLGLVGSASCNAAWHITVRRSHVAS